MIRADFVMLMNASPTISTTLTIHALEGALSLARVTFVL